MFREYRPRHSLQCTGEMESRAGVSSRHFPTEIRLSLLCDEQDFPGSSSLYKLPVIIPSIFSDCNVLLAKFQAFRYPETYLACVFLIIPMVRYKIGKFLTSRTELLTFSTVLDVTFPIIECDPVKRDKWQIHFFIHVANQPIPDECSWSSAKYRDKFLLSAPWQAVESGSSYECS